MNFDQLIGSQVLNINPATVALNLAVALVLALAISWVYRRTHHGLSYSQSFLSTLIILAILTTATMMIVGSNIVRAFTLLGAFTIIRFRTAIKDSRDIAFVFWSLITGMAVGTANYMIAAALTVFLGLVIAVLSRIRFGAFHGFDYILNFLAPASAGAGVLDPLITKYLKSANLLNVASRDQGAKLEYTYSIKFGNEKDVSEFVRESAVLPGLERVNVITAKDDVEY